MLGKVEIPHFFLPMFMLGITFLILLSLSCNSFTKQPSTGNTYFEVIKKTVTPLCNPEDKSMCLLILVFECQLCKALNLCFAFFQF